MIPAGDFDRSIGMEYYITDGPGCNGSIKRSADDFRVAEVFLEQRYEGGRYLVLDVEKTNWDTHHLIREMARMLRISQKRFSWAGTKDKRAVTSQRISIMNLEESELSRITLPDLKIRVLGRTNRALGLGDLIGNRFEITIRELSCPDAIANERSKRITEEIAEHRGVPNYFGVQRFGDVRPVTHLVGEALVRGRIEEAVFIYLAMPFEGELPATREARARLWESRDIPTALKEYPAYLGYEIAMMNRLVEHPDDWAHSFDVLSVNLMRLFVHAYQSRLYNELLSRRLETGLPLHMPEIGDVVCFAKDGLPDMNRQQMVTAENLDAVERLALRGRAFVTLPLIGFESALSGGEEGEREAALLEREKIRIEDFRVPENPGLGSGGTRRAALCPVLPECRLVEGSAELRFVLQKGSYATVVLREYMKSEISQEIGVEPVN